MSSENGWEPSHAPAELLEWRTVPGTNPPVRLQVMKGWPATIMMAYAADYNAYVEKLRDADSASFTPTNSVATSNHLNGTAMDLNWNDHPFHVSYGGYTPAMIATMRELIAFYEKTMFWSQDWDSPKDCMHHQLGYNTWNQPWVLDFINRKIRADGFSTFRRGGVVTPPPPPPPANNAADVLARATGITLAKATAILSQVSFALVKANCTNPRRIAAALAQWVIESGHFVYTEEIASGPENEERWKYKGRTWVQLTWLENYRGFSVWCHSLGLVPSPDYFVVRPRELADQKWAALGPAYWWAVKYPRINEYADRGDIDNVSKWVNAPAWVDKPDKHANHEKERRDAYNLALALGDQLLALTTSAPPPTPGDDMALVPQAQWDAFYQAYMGDIPSLSPLRKLGEGNIGPLHRVLRYMDANIHVPLMKLLAGLGHPQTLQDLQALAAADLTRYPDRADGKELANNILADLTSDPQAVVHQAAQELQIPAPPQYVYLPAPEALPAVVDPSSVGQLIGKAYDALQELRLADALPIEDRAPLAALIGVLQTKNGSQL